MRPDKIIDQRNGDVNCGATRANMYPAMNGKHHAVSGFAKFISAGSGLFDRRCCILPYLTLLSTGCEDSQILCRYG